MEEKLKYFWMMVGLPASGKSTWINHNIFDKNPILSTDGMLEEIAAHDGKTYNEVFQDNIDHVTKTFFNLIKDYSERGLDFAVDRTNLTKKSRKKILDMIPNDYIKVAIVVSCSEEDHQQRLVSRPGKTIPAHIIKNMKETYQEPTLDEGFRSITKINTSKNLE